MGGSLRVAIVAAEFNRPLVDAMVDAALDEARTHGATCSPLEPSRVPGCYEIPLVAATLAARRDVDVVVALGYIERGETQHGEVMGHVVHRALVEISLERTTSRSASGSSARARRSSRPRSAWTPTRGRP